MKGTILVNVHLDVLTRASTHLHHNDQLLLYFIYEDFDLSVVEVPVLDTCSIRQSIIAEPGQLTAVATWTNPTARDNTGDIPHVNCYPEPGAAFSIGVTKVTCFAKSINGHTATCNFDVVVAGMCKFGQVIISAT